ncbi:hypothetical protein CIC12_21540 [Burkholderia sp. SG-MS1]|nr:hypothetical protein [Paraburkholderia sp. SG-MS1]
MLMLAVRRPAGSIFGVSAPTPPDLTLTFQAALYASYASLVALERSVGLPVIAVIHRGLVGVAAAGTG